MIGKYAGVCWGANTSDNEKNYKRGLDCIESEHGRTWEFPDVYAIIDGYSAKVLREWYTHVGGSPTRLQASTRYINYSKNDGFKYVTPPTIKKNTKAYYEWIDTMSYINDMISKFINMYNIPVEDRCLSSQMSVKLYIFVAIFPLALTEGTWIRLNCQWQAVQTVAAHH